tara:strand:+ start:6 stop:1307 length:1302 start_codon:yes stop_codon:yes gene_type:complete
MSNKFFLYVFLVIISNYEYSNANELTFKIIEKSLGINKSFNASKENLKAIEENLNISRSEFLPSVELSTSLSSNESTNQTDQSGASTSDTNLDTETNSISVEQKIFQGFKGINQLKKSNLEISKANYELKQKEQETIINIVESFSNLIFYFENKNFNLENKNLLERQVEFDNARLQKGEITLTDLAQSESSLAGAQANLTTAETNYLVALSNFKKTTGMAEPDISALSYNYELSLPNSLSESLILSSKFNIDLKISELNFLISSLNYDIEKAKLSPSASLNFTKSESKDFSSSIDEVDKETLKATIKWPLIKGGKNFSEIKKAKHIKSKNKLLFEDKKDSVKTSTTNAWSEYISAKSVLLSTSSQVKAAEIANEGITLEYDSGNTRTTLEVIQSRSFLLDSKINNSEAKRDLIVTKFKLLAETGKLSLNSLKQ